MALLLASALSTVGCKVYLVPSGIDAIHAGAGLAPGQRVVGRWRDAFYDATVITVHHRLVKVAWDQPPPESSLLPREWVIELKSVAHALGSAICRREDSSGQAAHWQPCKVVALGGHTLKVLAMPDGQSLDLAASDVLAVPATLSDFIARRVDHALSVQRLSKEITPKAPRSAGQLVSVNQPVLALWQKSSWWDATVKAIDDQGQITVSWADGSAPRVLAKDEVAPLATGTSWRANDLAFCRFKGSQRWHPARVERDNGDGTLAVVYRDARRDTRIPQKDCQPAQ